MKGTFAFVVLAASCHLAQAQAPVSPPAPAADRQATPAKPGAVAKAATATDADRRALAEFAYQVAMAIPDNPHRTERTRAQQAVAEWCLERGWLDEAYLYANAIVGWRRGETLARLGERYLDAGNTDRARTLARAALDGMENEESDWGRERMLSQVAALQSRLGDEAAARSLVSPESPTEQGRFEANRTRHVAPERLAEQADAFDRGIATGSFDVVRACVDGYVVWLERTGAEPSARDRATKAIDGAMKWLPVDVQISTHLRLAEWMHAQGMRPECTDRVARADRAFADSNFEAEYVVPVGVTLVMARARMGDIEEARRSLVALQARYDSLKPEIPGLRRAISLRSIAEAWAALGNQDAALASFEAAVEEGAANPNARPRAVDLSATSLSMARAGIVPTPALKARMEALRSGLVDPW